MYMYINNIETFLLKQANTERQKVWPLREAGWGNEEYVKSRVPKVMKML